MSIEADLDVYVKQQADGPSDAELFERVIDHFEALFPETQLKEAPQFTRYGERLVLDPVRAFQVRGVTFLIAWGQGTGFASLFCASGTAGQPDLALINISPSTPKDKILGEIRRFIL